MINQTKKIILSLCPILKVNFQCFKDVQEILRTFVNRRFPSLDVTTCALKFNFIVFICRVARKFPYSSRLTNLITIFRFLKIIRISIFKWNSIFFKCYSAYPLYVIYDAKKIYAYASFLIYFSSSTVFLTPSPLSPSLDEDWIVNLL